MPKYEYKVVPAPTKGTKAKGVKTVEGRFALSVQGTLNQMGAEGWEYLRAELLPSDERSGLTGSTTNWRNVLVFRRLADDDIDELQPKLLHMPTDEPTVQNDPPLSAGAGQMLKDNGVEETSEVAGMTTSLRARAEQQQTETEVREDDRKSKDDTKENGPA
ncbi:MAG: DUF4177 domain-containing protein [Rhodobacteraceae bacterium]|nr:DUF4177 domain-containing protein [Paracoccaceae bacterium]